MQVLPNPTPPPTPTAGGSGSGNGPGSGSGSGNGPNGSDSEHHEASSGTPSSRSHHETHVPLSLPSAASQSPVTSALTLTLAASSRHPPRTSLPPLSSDSRHANPHDLRHHEDVVRLSAGVTLCHAYLASAAQALQRTNKNEENAAVRAVFPDARKLGEAVEALTRAAGPLHLDAENNKNNDKDQDPGNSVRQFRYYAVGGLDDVPLGMEELVTAGAATINARVRRSVEEEIVRTSLFEQFLTAVTDKGFFKDAGQPGEPRHEDRFRKVVNKFRAKLAAKAQEANLSQGGGPNSLSQGGGPNSTSPRDPPPPPMQHSPRRIHAARAKSPPMPMDEASANRTTEATSDAIVAAPSYNGQDLEEAERFKTTGNSFMQNKEYERAVESYSTALRLLPNGPTSHVFYANRAAALLSMKRFSDAAADAERSITLRPNYGKGHARLGLAKFFLEDYDAAVDAYSTSLHYDPDNASSRAYLAKARAKGGVDRKRPFRRDGAEADADQREAERLKSAGNSFMSGKEYRRAIEAYTAALALSPRGPHSHVYFSNRAAALCYLERYEEAELDSERSIALRPDYGKAHARLGLSRFFLEDYAGAVDAYTAALRFDPDNAASKSYLAKARGKLQATVNANNNSSKNNHPSDQIQTATMTNDPKVINMAQAMMHNPEMQKLAQGMMNNPDMMKEMMSKMENMDFKS